MLRERLHRSRIVDADRSQRGIVWLVIGENERHAGLPRKLDRPAARRIADRHDQPERSLGQQRRHGFRLACGIVVGLGDDGCVAGRPRALLEAGEGSRKDRVRRAGDEDGEDTPAPPDEASPHLARRETEFGHCFSHALTHGCARRAGAVHDSAHRCNGATGAAGDVPDGDGGEHGAPLEPFPMV